MLQRIQTIYLVITFVLTLLLFFIPMAGFTVNEGAAETVYSYVASGLEKSQYDVLQSLPPTTETIAHSWSLLILVVLILIVNVVGVFLYKNRVFQMRFNLLNILLNLGIYPLFFLFAWSSSQQISEAVEVSYSLPIIFPIINILLTYLAIRAIGKDEALVRSLDRIR